MKPVEIEFLMRDKLSGGLDAAGKSAESLGDRVERVSQSITERIAAQREQVRYVEQCLKDLRRQYDRLGPGKAQMEMRAEIEACTRALEEDKAVLTGLRSEHEKNSATARGLTMELRQLQGAMAKMRLEGQQNSQEYQTMAQRAALLQDTLGDLRTQTKILSHDNAGLQGLMSGANGLAGAFTMATGIMGVFASENENLIKIQTRVQSVLAITMGLQQVMNALNKDSAFRLVTVVKMKNLLTVANNRLAVSLGISNAAASALMATLTLGLSAVITGLIVAWNKYTDSQEDATAKAKERIEIEKEGWAQMIKTRFEIDSTLKSLKEFTGTKDEERRKVEEMNAKYGETFGYYDTLAQWYDTLCAKAEDYVRILFMQAKAQSLISAAVKADEKAREIEAGGQEEFRPFWGKGGKLNMFFGGSRFNQYGSDPAELAYRRAIEEQHDLRDEALRDAEFYQNQMRRLREGDGIDQVVAGSVKELENTIALKRKALKDITNKADYDAAMREIKTYEDRLETITGTGSKTKTKNNTTGQSVERLSDMEIAAQAKIEEQVVALKKEGYDKQRAEAELNFRKEKDRIAREERDRLELYEKLQAAGGKVNPAQRTTIVAQAHTQRIQAAQLLDKKLEEIDRKEEEDNRKKLEKLLAAYMDYDARRKEIERKHNEAIAQMRAQLSTVRIDALGQQMTGMFNGNVNLLARPVIDAAKLAEKGWKDAGEGIATVFSSQFGIDDAAGKQHEILVTPILSDGSVLSEDELNAYIDQTLNGAEDILKSDTLGIVIGVDVDPDGSAGEALHLLQEAFYDLKQNAADNIINDDLINRAIQVAEAAKKAELSKVDEAEAQSVTKDNDFLKRLFGDYSSMSFDKLRDLIAQAKQLQAYLNGKGSAEGITFISAAELKNIEKSPAELDKLRKALDKLLQTGEKGGSNKWENIFKTFQKGLAELKGANGIKDISGAIGTISGAASDAAGELADMFEQMGDTQTADALSGVQQVMSAVSNIGQGFAKGGIIGGIGAAVGEAMNFIGQAFAAEARHQEALKEIERAKLDFQRQYNLALLEQNLLLEEASNIFGERQINKAANAVQNYRDALAQFNRELAGSAAKGKSYDKMSGTWIDRMLGGAYSKAADAYKSGVGGLYDAQIVTGHKKTGFFGWGKGKDLYSSVLSVYPQLIDANGELDTVMLQSILDTRKMSDETRTYLENLIDLKDAMDEADKALEDYLSQTFGSLGQGALDSITTALKGGDAALENFADNAASVFEKLGEQVAYSLFFADKFDELQKQLKAVYGSGKNEMDIADDAMNLIDSFYNNIGSNVGAAQAWMEEWRRKAEEMGYDLWKDDATTQSGKAGAFTTLTQDQGTKLEGLMTSQQMHGASVDEKMDNVTAGLGGCLDALRRIAQNTDTLPLMLALWQTIKRDGLKIK